MSIGYIISTGYVVTYVLKFTVFVVRFEEALNAIKQLREYAE